MALPLLASPTQRRPVPTPMPQNSELQFRQVPQPLGAAEAGRFVVLAISKISAQFSSTMIVGLSETSKKRNSGRRAIP
jgi:hypothetical protein